MQDGTHCGHESGDRFGNDLVITKVELQPASRGSADGLVATGFEQPLEHINDVFNVLLKERN